MRWSLVLLAACGDNVEPLTPLHLDVVVGPGSVQIFTERTDGATAADDGAFILPRVETCVDDIDTMAAEPSCLTDVALLDGDRVVSDLVTFDPPAITVRGDVNAYASPALELTGCGGSATIPLDPSPFPIATLDVAGLGDGLVFASWTGDADEAMLTFTGSARSYRCVTAMPSYVVTATPVGPPMFSGGQVQLLAGLVVERTPYGIAAIRRGGSASAPFR